MRTHHSLVWLLILSLLVAGCTPAAPENPGLFYYCRREPSYAGAQGIIAAEERELTGSLEELVALYCQGPKDLTLTSALPKGCTLREARLEESVLKLSFDKRLAKLSGIELTLAVGCLARTFLPLTGAEQLVLSAEGALLDGQTSLALGLDDLQLEDDSLQRLHETLTVYYTDDDRRYLIAQEVTLNLAALENPEQELLSRLTTAPAGSTLRSPLPTGTQIRSVTVEGGLCTVDLSSQFSYNRFQSPRAQLLSLMAMVNTLTALEHIQEVEFTLKGQLLIRYGSISIGKPLVQDSRFLGPVRRGLGEVDGTIYLLQGEDRTLLAIPTRLRQSQTLSSEEVVMATLLGDSGRNALTSGIPAGTRLLGIRREEGHCIVDLSGEYMSQPQNLLSAGRAIAASLCALEGIETVSITVEGTVPVEQDAALFTELTPSANWFS